MTRKTLALTALAVGAAVLLAACGPREPEKDATAAAMPGADVAAETAVEPAPVDTSTAGGVTAGSEPAATAPPAAPAAPPPTLPEDDAKQPPPKY